MDVPNAVAVNGERLIQREILLAARARGRPARVFDVGANVGEWSASCGEIATQVGVEVRIHAFEPEPSARQQLRRRCSAVPELSIEPLAVGDEDTSLELQVVAPGAGTNSLVAMPGQRISETVEVECVRLDTYCADRGIEAIDLVKIDTEGNDYNVLVGLGDALGEGRVGCVQFEYNARWVLFRRYLKDVFDLVEPLGMSVAKVVPEGLVTFARWTPELETFREGNYLIYRPDTKPGLPERAWWL